MQRHCLRVPLAVIKYHNHKQLGEDSYFSLLVPRSPPSGKSAGTEAESMEECCLLICFSLLILLSYSIEDPHTSITNLENAFQSCLQLNLVEAFSRLRFLPLR